MSESWLNDFFVRAMLGGIGIALAAGPLGCFVTWKRLSYFGDTLAHASLLGVALALLLHISVPLGVFLIAALVAVMLVALQRLRGLAGDAILGVMAHSLLALGLVVLALMDSVRIDVMSLLLGDILAIRRQDLLIIWFGAGLILLVLVLLWRPLLASTVSQEIAGAEGQSPDNMQLIFTLLIAAMVALSIRLVGAMLITALLLLPAVSARRLARLPETMALLAMGFGVAAVVAGLLGSLKFDTPAGPSIVLAALLLFMLSAPMAWWLTQRRRTRAIST